MMNSITILLITSVVFLGIWIYSRFLLNPKRMIDDIIAEHEKRLRHRIEAVDGQGFQLYTDDIPTHITWNNIQNLELQEDWSMQGHLKDGGTFFIDKACVSRLALLKQMPKGLTGFDDVRVDAYFAGLSSCPICGFKAVDDGECLHCIYSVEGEDRYREEGESREDYLKREQLEYFSDEYEPNESVEALLKRVSQNETFEHDSAWVLYPNVEEIKQALKEAQ